jgi:branched-chain amino acid transport system permease protein
MVRHRSNLIRLLFLLAMIVWPFIIRDDYAVSVMVMAGLYATLTLGLGLLLGQAGQISFGHGAFFGLGAYVSALLTTKLGVPPLLSISAGAIGAGFVAYVVGRPVLRLRFYFLALATMGLGTIFVVIAKEMRWLTGGTWGVTAIPWFGIAGFEADDYLKQYYLVWAVAVALWLFSERALKSRVGRALRALAASEVAASTLAIDTAGWKLRTFVVSAIYAGIGGGLYAFTLTAINPNDFSISLAIIVVIMVMVGGADNLFGVLIGTILMTWVGRAFLSYEEYSGGLYAIVLILLLIFLPGGIAGGLPEQMARILRLFRLKASAVSGEPLPPEYTPAAPAGPGNDPEAAPLSGAPLLRIEKVTVSFGGLFAVNDVSLDVAEGAIAALIGPNGAGKTTLFNVLSGLQKPLAGRVSFAGEDITSKPAASIARLGMARTFQNLRVFGNMTVLENVMVGRHRHEAAHFLSAGFGLRRQVREEEESRKESLKALALVGLEGRAELPVTSLPYGEQRLVEIARALATEPRLLLLDEPAAGMNAPERKRLMEQIVRIRNAGITVLLIGHDMELVMGVSDRVSVLDYGRLIAAGRPDEIRTNPAVVEAYLGIRRERPTTSSDLRDEKDVRAAALPTEGKVLLSVQGISTYYGSIRAIKDVSLQVAAGETFVVLGSNGAGKTTLLRTISGILRPQKGQIIYRDNDIARLAPSKIATAGIGHVPEGRHVFPTLTVHDNLLLGAHCRTGNGGIRDDFDLVYDLFPVLKRRRTQAAGTLSGGEQQMLSIGRALMGSPQLLMLDEPSMGVAPLIVEHIFETLATLNSRGLTLLMVEQNAEMALSIAHNTVVLQTGSVALYGPAHVLQKDERVQALYLGTSQPS